MPARIASGNPVLPRLVAMGVLSQAPGSPN
jgi:hypothetical protein